MSSTAEAGMEGLKVKQIDPLIPENGPLHHTDDYETDALIIRRGCPFSLTIKHEGFKQEEDEFYFLLKTGKNAKQKDGSAIEIHNEEPSKESPSFQITSTSDSEFRVSVNTCVNTLVSRYSLSVISTERSNKKKRRVEFEHPQFVYILFNPWNEDDEVYMEDEKLREEYVLNDNGCVFVSGHRWRPWWFAQFTDAALQCTFDLLEKVRPSWRNNAREVARAISSRCNSCDNDGLLVGNWSGDYEGGVKPWEWSGSAAIFRKYLISGEPVQYGQCWVFSGLTTSMMRCLGVPTRSVTNYDSAHDSDNNCTFDRYFDSDWNYLEDESDDSCWNFHVWNDVWMSRPDLPAGMGGWQAIDGTPQEESKGSFRCGPASLQAIREGDVNRPHDTKFVFAEVNADIVYWKPASKDGGKKWVAQRVKKDKVGTAILTKMPNSNQTQNVTSDYKHKEGSIFERTSVMNALKKVKNPAIEAIELKDVKFSSTVERNVSTEEAIVVAVRVCNNTSESLSIATAVQAHVIRYTGVKVGSLQPQRKDNETLGAGCEGQYEFRYDSSMYAKYLDENISIRFVIMSRLVGSSQAYVTHKICNIQKPDLNLEIDGNGSGAVKSGDTIQVKVSIPSIYGIDTYTGASLDVDCSVIDNVNMKLENSKADGSAVVVKSFTIKDVKKARKSDLVITFNSKEISGIHGSLTLDVTPK